MPALASQLPPVAGVGYPNIPIDRGKKLSAFVGYSYGSDSNISRTKSATAISDTFQEALIGIVYVSGLPTSSFDVRYEGKLEFFQKQTALSYMDHALKASYFYQTESLLYIARGSYESLNESAQIEAVGLTREQRIFVVPFDLGFRMGQLELTAGYSLRQNIYPDYDSQDYFEQVLDTELRLWRGETTNYFVHFGAGSVAYRRNITNRRDDYSHQRLYAGLRSERTARSGYELAAGVQGNEVAGLSGVQEEFFASLRGTWLLMSGRMALVGGYTQGAEASLQSDYKSVSRVTARVSYAANSRLSFTAGVTTDSAGFTDKDSSSTTPDNMTRIAADVGVMYEIGSPQRAHGRVFFSFGTESRTGPSAFDHDNDTSTPDMDYNYTRTRWFGGVALVY